MKKERKGSQLFGSHAASSGTDDGKGEADSDEDTANASASSDPEYCFTPILGDDSDELTESLFEQLEEGAKWDTDIYSVIKDGANLYAISTDEYEGCSPIHIAAYMIDSNTAAINNILETFDNPEERKNYIFLKNNNEKNVLSILLERTLSGGDDGLSAPALISVLSYLTPDEQKIALDEQLSETAKEALESDEYVISVDRQEDITFVNQLSQFQPIEMCEQRRREEAKLQSEYDSGDEGLGNLGDIQNRKFTARVSYQMTTQPDGKIKSVPELSLIPSDWRLPTATKGNTQGDHVTAYVLLVSSLSHCKGEHVKNLPEIIHTMICRVLPDKVNHFLEKKNAIEATLKAHSQMRKEAIASLKIECEKPPQFVSHIEDSLHRTEIECIARYVEETIDQFIMVVNEMEGESFSQKRKDGVKINFILTKLESFVNEHPRLQDVEFKDFKDNLVAQITLEAQKPTNNKSGAVTDKLLRQIANQVAQTNGDKLTPAFLTSGAGAAAGAAADKLNRGKLVAFLTKLTPLKKYHEGFEVNHTHKLIATLATEKNAMERREHLVNIGKSCAKLFDYPRVGNAELDDVSVLYSAIPRHLIIFCCAFKQLGLLSGDEKKLMYDAFLKHILTLQLWSDHVIAVAGADSKPGELTITLLKEKILGFATIDAEGNYSMKASAGTPSALLQMLKAPFFQQLKAATAAPPSAAADSSPDPSAKPPG